MDFGLSDEQRMLKTSARDFFEKECPKSFVKEMMKDEQGFARSLWEKMAGLGWLGLAFDEKYGGGGGTFLDLTILLEEMGRSLLPGPFFATVVQAGLTILEAGNEEQKRTLLSAISRGELLATLALLEEDWVSPIENIKTVAQRSGEDFVIQGSKLFVPDAHVANIIICPAVMNDTKGDANKVSLFIVDTRSPGISITPLNTITGDKLSEVRFSNVKVARSHILGQLGEGRPCLERSVPKMVVAKCAEMVGSAQQTLEMTIQYIKERKQFGRPLGSFQALQHYSADIVTDVEGCRHITSQAAWMLSEGLSCKKEVAIAKAWCSDALKRITMTSHQMHGGIGFTEEHNLHLFYKKAKAWELFLGDSDLHRETVAVEMGL